MLNLKSVYATSVNFVRYLLFYSVIGIAIGLASGLFLVSLKNISEFHLTHAWLIYFLPFGGLLIGFIYEKSNSQLAKGNNLILESYQKYQHIPILMAPIVLITTLLTHFFGGSAGREGTAVQMGVSLADFLSSTFKIFKTNKKTIILIGIASGFASVFGTPITGIFFAFELVCFSNVALLAVLPTIYTAYIAYFTVEILGIHHTNYTLINFPNIDLYSIFWIAIVSVVFGITALLFSKNLHFWNHFFKKIIAFAPFRPFVGGLVLLGLFLILDVKFQGLGIEYIQKAFVQKANNQDFILKLLLTGLTLGSGFKGGEVTPLFFVGATLGSCLSVFVPLPLSFLAALGFVSVFAGATHTPLACSIMAIEMFGFPIAFFALLSCYIAYLFSGKTGIYTSQLICNQQYKIIKK